MTKSTVSLGLRRTRQALAASMILLLLSACAHERMRGNAQALMHAGQYEEAMDLLEQAAREYPGQAVLRASLISSRNEALSRLLAEAASARASGNLDEVEQLLKRALRFDTGGKRVSSLLLELDTERRQRQALALAQVAVDEGKPEVARRIVTDALKDNPRQPELLAMQRSLDATLRQAQVRAAQQGLAEARPISIDFRDASLRTVLDVVTRNSGVNFILDKDVRADVRVTVFLRSARVEEAIDLITSTHGLAKKTLDGNTVLIYPNTPEKQREHQEQVVRVFHLASAEAKGAAAFLRSMMRIKEPHVDERANMLALRESPETIELAERLLALYDTHEPEVLLELEVIEVRSNRLMNLGVQLPDSFSLTVLNPNGAQGGLTLSNLNHVSPSRIGVSVGSTLINLRRELGDVNTLANPRIRAKNREKAKVLIGDKVPVITATTGQGGFVSDSVSYLDVGLKLEVEPVVYADDEVSIKVGLEVSTLAREVRTNSGSLAYQIGTRNASTLLRLRDGETQLLAGLISKEDRSSALGLPILADLPLAGRLFSSTKDESQKTELVLAITPRVLRNIRRPDAAQAELWVGTETQPRLRSYGGRLPPVSEPSKTTSKSTPVATPGGSVPVVTLGSPPGAERPVPAAQGEESANLQLGWQGPAQVKVGEEFSVELVLNSPVSLRGAPLQLQFDKARLAIVDVEEGSYFRQGGAATNFTKSIVQGEGRVNAGIIRSMASGTPGQGTLLRLKLKAQAAGAAEIGVTRFEPIAVGREQAQAPQTVVHKVVVQ